MNQLNQYIFDPSDLEKYTGVSAVMQRDWRRRGILPSEDWPPYCVRQSNGRWRYSFDCLFYVYIIGHIAERGFYMYQAAEFAGDVLRGAIDYLEYKNLGEKGLPKNFRRYLAIFPADPNETPMVLENAIVREWATRAITNLSELSHEHPEFIHIIDIVSFTETFSKNLNLEEDKSNKLRQWITASGVCEGGDE